VVIFLVVTAFAAFSEEKDGVRYESAELYRELGVTPQ
jgi:hypothetical protein